MTQHNICSRRHLFGLFAAPAIVRASSLMPVSVWREPTLYLSAKEFWDLMAAVSPIVAKIVAEEGFPASGFIRRIGGYNILMDPERARKDHAEFARRFVDACGSPFPSRRAILNDCGDLVYAA